MKASLKTACLACTLLLAAAQAAHAGEALINHVDYRFACVKSKVKLEVRAGSQEWLLISNRCGDEECRAEPACASEEGRQLMQGLGATERVMLDLACYNGRLHRRQIDANGFFNIQRYPGKPPFGCDPTDNSQFTAAYFIPDDAMSATNAPPLK